MGYSYFAPRPNAWTRHQTRVEAFGRVSKPLYHFAVLLKRTRSEVGAHLQVTVQCRSLWLSGGVAHPSVEPCTSKLIRLLTHSRPNACPADSNSIQSFRLLNAATALLLQSAATCLLAKNILQIPLQNLPKINQDSNLPRTTCERSPGSSGVRKRKDQWCLCLCYQTMHPDLYSSRPPSSSYRWPTPHISIISAYLHIHHQ